MVTLILDDDSDAIVLGKDDGPFPSPALIAWLDATCPNAWSWRRDHAFNVYFTFSDPASAEAFRARFGAREA